MKFYNHSYFISNITNTKLLTLHQLHEACYQVNITSFEMDSEFLKFVDIFISNEIITFKKKLIQNIIRTVDKYCCTDRYKILCSEIDFLHMNGWMY